MRYALVGYGRMGRAIEALAATRGHELVAVIDPAVRAPLASSRIGIATLRGAEVAFEFSTPSTAEGNVAALLGAGLAVVCGTTGWSSSSPRVARALRRSRAGLLVAPNFSLGMSLFARVVAECARVLGRSGLYDPFVLEYHHRGKADAPSGTARHLAGRVAESDPRRPALWEGGLDGALPSGTIHVASVRAGHEPGTHTVGFDGEHDLITLTHRARGRSALALGAVLAGEWLRGRSGPHTFDEVVADLLRARPRAAAPRRAGRRRR